MNLLENLQVSPSEGCVKWIYNSREVTIPLSTVGQALEDSVHQKVVVSVCDGKYPKLLKVFNFIGDEECTIEEPEQFQFYFLKEHSVHGVSVVCSSIEPIDGRFDWQFFILYPACELHRFSPSY
jgi:hypothetical protein